MRPEIRLTAECPAGHTWDVWAELAEKVEGGKPVATAYLDVEQLVCPTCGVRADSVEEPESLA